VTRPPADATTRFSSRVADYAAHRPRYPEALYRFLRDRLGVGPGRTVVDVGSGTGIFAEPLLEMGCPVYCVEPNTPMRAEAERTLGSKFRSFHSVDATAEATTLSDRCADLVTAAQAFHWFDPARFRDECRRLLRPGGRAALVWNSRKICGTPFLEAYEALLNEFGTDYAAVRHDCADPQRLRQFFADGFERVTFPNAQHLDEAGLRGRLLSSSYTPGPDDPRRPAMVAALTRLFERHQRSGTLSIDYDTELYFGTP
jgi:ubiquinone/menaquinone biosynthesis C-methylase UbiE